jgi:hypothetical protein
MRGEFSVVNKALLTFPHCVDCENLMAILLHQALFCIPFVNVLQISGLRSTTARIEGHVVLVKLEKNPPTACIKATT